MRRLSFLSVFLGAAFALAAPARADGVVLNGISPRSLSRGGTNLGHADNGGVIHDNPAAMVNLDGCGLFEVGTIGLISTFDYSDPDNPGGVDSNEFTPLGEFSYVRKSADGIWAYGLGVFSEAGFCENYTMQGPAPFFPGPQKYKSLGALGKILPGVSCRLTDRLAVGGTFGVGVSHAELQGPYFLQGPGLPGTPTLMTLHGTDAAPVWSMALQFALTDTTTIGATYLSASRFELEGETRVILPFGMGNVIYDSELEVEWPESVGIGVRQLLGPCQAVSADVIWFGWSGSFDTFQLRLRNPSNPLFPAIVENIPLNWRDSVSVRVGYERQLVGGVLRLGYVNHRNPIPAGTQTPFIQATLQHAFSGGYAWQWGQWTVDAGYMYLFGPTQNVGASQLLGGDFSNSSHDAAVHAFFIGLQKPL
jgi:long-subunit fatty acid transport protein